MQFFPPKKLQTSGAPWVSCGIFLLQAWLWGRWSRLRHRFPHPLCMFFVIHPPKKESKPGMDGALMSFFPQSIPRGILCQRLHSAPLPGSPRSGNACSVPFTRIQPKSGSLPPESRGSRWCCERGVPPRDSGTPPLSFPGRVQQWETIPVIFKILCTFWGGSWGSLPPFPMNF